MKKLILFIAVVFIFGLLPLAAQDVLFSFTINNNDPVNSVVSVFGQFDGTGNSNAAGYTVVFYYNSNEATSASGDVDYTGTSALGWAISGNTNYSNIVQTNPLVPITHNHRIEIGVFDGNFAGSNFPTTPTLLLTIKFNKSVGNPLQGGKVYIGATADTDPAIVYYDNSFNPYNVAVTGARQGILPLNLVSFTAEKLEQKSSLLKWSTANEINTSNFTIQRSTDKIEWSNAGKVNAAGNSQIILNYQFVDENVYNGKDANLKVYYRLMMTDLDGSFKISPVRDVQFGNPNSSTLLSSYEFLVYPNPASEGIHVEWDANQLDQPTSLEFYDVSGKLIYTEKVEDQTNQHYVDFNQTNIQTGLCLMRVMSGDKAIEYKQIVVGQNH